MPLGCLEERTNLLPNKRIYRLGPGPRRTRRYRKSEIRRYALLHFQGQVQGLAVAARRGCDDESVASSWCATGITTAPAPTAAAAQEHCQQRHESPPGSQRTVAGGRREEDHDSQSSENPLPLPRHGTARDKRQSRVSRRRHGNGHSRHGRSTDLHRGWRNRAGSTLGRTGATECCSSSDSSAADCQCIDNRSAGLRRHRTNTASMHAQAETRCSARPRQRYGLWAGGRAAGNHQRSGRRTRRGW